MATKWGLNVLFCMPDRAKCMLLVSVMKETGPRLHGSLLNEARILFVVVEQGHDSYSAYQIGQLCPIGLKNPWPASDMPTVKPVSNRRPLPPAITGKRSQARPPNQAHMP
jgi:hypothetical protein